ncbi:WD40 repeat domain-containing protein [Embleya sp. NPDC005971]|uniref:WD40 repeat domain-containing protein n=1 Tax=Embleya sp. NPDC005971 TaxID=3156724 RepID=UPI0033DD278E
MPRREAARLYSGSRLRQARDHAEAHEVSRTARAFLDACDAAVEETRRTHDAERLRKHRNRRRWRIATGVIGVLAVLAATTTVVAVRFAVESDRRGDRLRNELDAALSRELSIEAERLRGIDVSLAAQADIAAYRKDPSPTTLGNLLDSAARPLAAVLPDSPSNRVLFSPDRHTLATATFGRTGTSGDTTHDASITLWGVGDPERPLRLADFPIRGSTEIGLAFSPDGRTLAVAGKGFIEFRNTADPHQPTLRASNGSTARGALSFSPDGRSLAVTANDGIDLWNTSNPDHPEPQGVHFKVSADPSVSDIAFSPTGHTLATTDGNSVRLWDTTVTERPSPRPRTLDGHTAPIDTLAFSPDGHTIPTGGQDAAVRLWNLTDIDNPTPWRLPLAGGSASVTSIAFSPDGHTLATADRDATARLWNISDPDRTIPRTDPLFAHDRDQNGRGLPSTGANLSFSADGRILASSGPTRLWTLPTYVTATRTGEDGNPATFRYSPDGHTLAVAARGEIRLWDFVRPGHPTPRTRTLATDRETATALSFSPDGRTLAAVTSDTNPRIIKLGPDGRPPADSTDDEPTATIRFWNLTDPDRPTPRPHALTGFPAARTTVLYSPDGRTLVAVGQGHGWQTWDVSDPDRPALRTAIGTDTELAAALSPDGRTLAVSIFDPDTDVVLWDVTDPTRPKRRPGSITLDSDVVSAVAFGANSRTLVTAGSRSTRLWDTSDPDHPTPRPNSLDTNGDSVDSLSLTTDGDMLTTSGISGPVRLWDLTDPDHPAPHTTPIAASGYRPLDFSPDGHTLAFMEETDAVSLRLVRAQDAIRHICAATTGSFEQAGQALRHTLTPPCPTPPNG